MLDLDAIEARANAATPGPWRVGATYDPEINVDVTNADGNLVGPKDEDFIAAAREDVPALVAEVRRLRAALAMSNADVQAMGIGCCQGTDAAETLRTNPETGAREFALYLNAPDGPKVWIDCVACPMCGERFPAEPRR